MIVGELRHGQLTIIDRLRESVRLAEGLSDAGDLSGESRDRSPVAGEPLCQAE